jgi:hypothetical protein
MKKVIHFFPVEIYAQQKKIGRENQVKNCLISRKQILYMATYI